jgi:L-amino acid N-acyltransferase YncA
MVATDWSSVARIYREGIDTGDATFEHEVPSFAQWTRARLAEPRLVARDGSQQVLGWAALTPASSRPVYRGVAEVSVYVVPAHSGRGIGGALLRVLIEESERAGLWTLLAGIFPENRASIALHEHCGFRLLGVQHRVGQMPDGRWRDVAIYERRSSLVGVD